MKQLIEKTKVQDIINERKNKKRALQENEGTGDDVKITAKKIRQQQLIGKDYDENENRISGGLLRSIFAKNKNET